MNDLFVHYAAQLWTTQRILVQVFLSRSEIQKGKFGNRSRDPNSIELRHRCVENVQLCVKLLGESRAQPHRSRARGTAIRGDHDRSESEAHGAGTRPFMFAWQTPI